MVNAQNLRVSHARNNNAGNNAGNKNTGNNDGGYSWTLTRGASRTHARTHDDGGGDDDDHDDHDDHDDVDGCRQRR